MKKKQYGHAKVKLKYFRYEKNENFLNVKNLHLNVYTFIILRAYFIYFQLKTLLFFVFLYGSPCVLLL